MQTSIYSNIIISSTLSTVDREKLNTPTKIANLVSRSRSHNILVHFDIRSEVFAPDTNLVQRRIFFSNNNYVGTFSSANSVRRNYARGCDSYQQSVSTASTCIYTRLWSDDLKGRKFAERIDSTRITARFNHNNYSQFMTAGVGLMTEIT